MIHCLFGQYKISFILLILITACKSSEKTAAQKAYEKRQQEINERDEFRTKYPCDTITKYITAIDTLYTTIKSDTTSVKDTIKITKYQLKTKTIERVVSIIDQSIVKNARDSIDQLDYQLLQITDLANKQAANLETKDAQFKNASLEKKQWMWRAIGTWIGMAIFIAAALFYLIKIK